jgi:hypothetical protein
MKASLGTNFGRHPQNGKPEIAKPEKGENHALSTVRGWDSGSPHRYILHVLACRERDDDGP